MMCGFWGRVHRWQLGKVTLFDVWAMQCARLSDRGTVKMYDQRKLPLEVMIVMFDDYRDVAPSIHEMYIRGTRPRLPRRFWKESERF
jgi:hypothetical protein